MFINKLNINNFGIIGNLECIPSSLNVIYGQNGSGKSTFVTVLEYLLRDEINNGKKISKLAKNGTDNFKLEIQLNHNGKDINFNYNLKKNTVEKQLKYDKEIYNSSEAINRFQSILDPKVINYSFIRQLKNDKIVESTPTERLNILKTIFGLEELQKIVNEKKLTISNYENELKDINGKLSVLRSTKFEYMDIPKLHDIEDIKRNIERLKEIESIHLKYLDEKQSYEKLKIQYDMNLKNRDKLNEQINKLSKDKINLLKDKESYELEYNNILENISDNITKDTVIQYLIDSKYKNESLKSEIQNKISEYKNDLKLKESIEKELLDVKLIDFLEKTFQEIDERELDGIESEIESLNNTIIDLEYKVKEFDKLLNSLKDLELEISNLKFSYTTEYDGIEDLYNQLSIDKTTIGNKIDTLEKEKELIKDGKCNKCKRPFDNHEDELKNIDIELENLYIKLHNILPEMQTLNSKINDKKKYNNDLVVYEQKLNQLSKLKENINPHNVDDIELLSCKNRLKDLKVKQSEIVSILKEINEYENSKKVYEISKKQYDSLNSKLDNINIKLESFSINVWDKNLKDIESDLIYLDTTLTKVKSLDMQYKNFTEKFASIGKDIMLLNDELESINLDKPNEPLQPKDIDFTSYKSDLEKYQIMEIEYNSTLKEIERINNYNFTIKKNEIDCKDEISKLEKSYESISKMQSIEEESKKVLDKDFPSYVIRSNTEYIEWKLNQMFTRIYRKDYKFTFEISEKGNSIDLLYHSIIENLVDENVKSLSGGEQQIVETLLRVILASMSGIKFLVLDECDSWLSDTFSQNLFEVINEEGFEQIFIITHKLSTQMILTNNYNANLINMEN